MNTQSSQQPETHQNSTILAAKNMEKNQRGFAAMDREKQKEIASKGGKAAHEKGTAHRFTAEEARKAGRKGGEAVSRDRQHMAMIGREGGKSRSHSHDHHEMEPAPAEPQTVENTPTRD